MSALDQPKFRRRKTARPAEIVAAAMEVFSEKGFAAARLDEIAARAGVSKGAIYLYFETKEDVFRAVVEQAVAPNLDLITAMIAAHPGPFPDLVRMITARAAEVLFTTKVAGVAKIVIGEARNFPEIARLWYDHLVSRALGALTAAVTAAQARGEVRPGDARTYALQLMSPLVVALIYRETFAPVGAPDFDLQALSGQHAETLLYGLSAEQRPEDQQP